MCIKIQECNAIEDTKQYREPIFILRILQRSGTNNLYDLLLLHPDCGNPAPIWEDYFIHHIDLVLHYVQTLSNQWNLKGESKDIQTDKLCAGLGDGILSFLAEKTKKKRLVTKTPSVHNLEYFFKFFPKSCLIIIVRDGRSVVESGRRSFGWNYEMAMTRWAEASRAIQSFRRLNSESDHKYLIVRYEDLYSNIEQELPRVLAFLNLDIEKYDLEAAKNLPVRGTSDLKKIGRKEIHWDSTEKHQGFAPLARWNGWGRYLHERFNSIAGEYSTHFGYQLMQFPNNRFLWNVWNGILNIRLSILWKLRVVKRLSVIIHKQ